MKLSGAQWNEREHYLEHTALEQNNKASQMLFVVFEAVPGVSPKGWRCPTYYPAELGCASLQVPVDAILTVLSDTSHDVCLCCDLPYVNT